LQISLTRIFSTAGLQAVNFGYPDGVSHNSARRIEVGEAGYRYGEPVGTFFALIPKVKTENVLSPLGRQEERTAATLTLRGPERRGTFFIQLTNPRIHQRKAQENET
jgi:hypothetical protein